MLQYILTGLAGIVLGIVAMRVWQMREAPADDGADAEPATSGTPAKALALPSTRTMLIGAGALVALAVAIFAFRSSDSDGSSAQTAAMTSGGAVQDNLADVDTMINRLAKRLEENPDDGEGFRMLGWSYVMTNRPDQAIAPYKRALELLPNQANIHAGYGEALVGIARDKVTPEARAAFQKAVSLDPGEPRARHFLALWKSQNGQEKAALEEWIALANSGLPDAPWQADVRRRIDATAKSLGVDIASRLKHPAPAEAIAGPPALDQATVQSAQALPAQQREQMVDGMVEGLAAKLANNPGNADGWIMLLRSRMVRAEKEQAGKDLIAARKGLAKDMTEVGKVNAAASGLGVPGA